MNSQRDPLAEALASWRIKPAADPNFRPAVIARLTAAGPALDWPSYLRGHSSRWAAAALIVLGVAAWGGHEAGRIQNQANRDQLADTYVRQLDPRAMAGPQQ